MEPEEVAAAFDYLEQAGKVHHFGVSNQNPMMMELLKTAVKQPLKVNQLQLSAAFTPSFEAGSMLTWKVLKQLFEMVVSLSIVA